MPKARAKLKAALKKRLKAKLKGKGKPKKTRGSDGRERGSLTLLTDVINRLGASVSKTSKSELTVTQFNHPPFMIDLKKLRIVEPEPAETTNVTPAPAAADAAE